MSGGSGRALAGIDRGRWRSISFGFGRTPQHSLALLRGLNQLGAIGVPIIARLSRKSLLVESPVGTLGIAWPPAWRQPCWPCRGAAVVRVHDVAATRVPFSLRQAVINRDYEAWAEILWYGWVRGGVSIPLPRIRDASGLRCRKSPGRRRARPPGSEPGGGDRQDAFGLRSDRPAPNQRAAGSTSTCAVRSLLRRAYLTRALRLSAGIVIGAAQSLRGQRHQVFSAGDKLPDAVEQDIETHLEDRIVTAPSVSSARRVVSTMRPVVTSSSAEHLPQ